MSGCVQPLIGTYHLSTPPSPPFVPPPYEPFGCRLYIDPANPACYSGSGNRLLNVVDPLSFGATINNATYNSSLNEGVFTFNGAAGNQYIITDNLYTVMGSRNITIEMWIYATANGSAVMEVGQNDITTGWRVNNIEYGFVGPFFNLRSGFLNSSNTVFYNGPGGSPGLNKWMHICVTYQYSFAPTVYYNGVAGANPNTGLRKEPWNQSPLLPGQSASYYAVAFGAGSSQNSLGLTSSMFTGRMGIVRVYDFPLSGAQVLTNYNGVKARYGL